VGGRRLHAGRRLAARASRCRGGHNWQLPPSQRAATLTMSATCVAEMTAPAVILTGRIMVVTGGRVQMNHSTRTSMKVPARLGHSAGSAAWGERGGVREERAAPRMPGAEPPVEAAGARCARACAHSR